MKIHNAVRMASIACVALIASGAALALAQTADSSPGTAVTPLIVNLPAGSWVESFLSIAEPSIVSILCFLVSILSIRLGGPVGQFLKTYVTQAVIAKAVAYGVGAVDGAVAGQQLEVHTANAVFNSALNFLNANEPAIATWLGAALKSEVFAHMSSSGLLTADATVSVVTSPVPVADPIK